MSLLRALPDWSATWPALIEIVVLFLVLYSILRFLQGTRGAGVLRGLVFLLLMAVLLQSYHLDNFADFSGPIQNSITTTKLILLFSLIVFSLGMFLLSLRQMVRFTILIGTDIKELDHVCTDGCHIHGVPLLEHIFLRAMNRFTFGLRGLYFLVAAMVWFISSYAFIGFTILITALLILYQDIRAPGGHRKEEV